VEIKDSLVAPQGRNQILGEGNNGHGFYNFIRGSEDRLDWFARKEDMVIYAEWAGPGIQSKTACNQAPSKFMAIFAVVIEDRLVYEPAEIEKLLGEAPEGVYILPWLGKDVLVDMKNPDKHVDVINEHVEDVEECDPWILETFGVKGIGEGIVYYPLLPEEDIATIRATMFKAKGEKHRTEKSKKSVSITPEKIKDIDTFCDTVLTRARLTQGVAEACLGSTDDLQIGQFLRWVSADVIKECGDLLQGANLEWKDVAKQVNKKALAYFRCLI
jgi:hypothetical protein